MPLKFLSRKDPLIIHPYGGYINNTHIRARARVLEDERIHVKPNDKIFRNLVNSYKRIESDEKAYFPVIVTWAGKEIEVISDKEGYLHINIPHELSNLSEKADTLKITYSVNNPTLNYSIESECFKPDSEANFGIITDLDDTVIHTGVSSRLKWRLMVNTFLKPVESRTAIKDVRPFFRALEQDGLNPFFYVSNSPWNLHRYLSNFLKIQDLPRGSILLRDIGINSREFKLRESKKNRIRQIITFYPHLKFILVGDAAEIDTDIYIDIATEFGDRIRAIFIKTVSRTKNVNRVRSLIEKSTDIPVELVETYLEGIDKAQKIGLI